MLWGCSASLPVVERPSSQYDQRIRSIVIHYTAEDFAESSRLLRHDGRVSAHYLIPQTGDPSHSGSELSIYRLVPDSERAWHAGQSHWRGRSNLNDTSIGIELVYRPQCPVHGLSQQSEGGVSRWHCDDPPFDPAQIQLLIRLLQQLLAAHPQITSTDIVAHADIAPLRKRDPGSAFPWALLHQHGIGAWYDAETLAHYQQVFAVVPVPLTLLQQGLAAYGYQLESSGQLDHQTRAVLAAFQLHFLPWGRSSEADRNSAAVLFSLLKRYRPTQHERLWRAYLNQACRAPEPALDWACQHGPL
ncbi:N-acetylmuramoyl-L-alanine amidase [Ferrimonas pelagia]|uniref:N-acetylmuramoyl-L-alanine amidase n=1 Tax=Ferrimonas pelagia TaxID=1177826 RepID=A0ABP9EKD0_9GAMM